MTKLAQGILSSSFLFLGQVGSIGPLWKGLEAPLLHDSGTSSQMATEMPAR